MVWFSIILNSLSKRFMLHLYKLLQDCVIWLGETNFRFRLTIFIRIKTRLDFFINSCIYVFISSILNYVLCKLKPFHKNELWTIFLMRFFMVPKQFAELPLLTLLFLLLNLYPKNHLSLALWLSLLPSIAVVNPTCQLLPLITLLQPH